MHVTIRMYLYSVVIQQWLTIHSMMLAYTTNISSNIYCSVTESILNVIKCLAQHWSCLAYQTDLEDGELCPFDDVNSEPPRYTASSQMLFFMSPLFVSLE